MSFISEIIDSTAEFESPKRFYYWSSLATLSAIANNKLHLEKFSYKLYPNLFVVLIGRSGLRKSAPVALARDLVDKVDNTRVIAGRNSIQGVITELSNGNTAGGAILKDSIGFLISMEFGSFLLKNDDDALTILTDLYDGQNNPAWKYGLKHSKNKLTNVCLTMLGASNEPHFNAAIPPQDVAGGFIARTLLVYEDEKRTVNSLMKAPTRQPDQKMLVDHLKEIAKLKGEFRMMPDAIVEYDKWYDDFQKVKIQDVTGTVDRIHDTILKVSMLVSLSDRLDLIITKDHINEAINACLECIANLKKMSMPSGKAPMARQTGLLLSELVKAPGNELSRLKFLQKHWGEVDAFDLDRIVDTMQAANYITITRKGGDTVFKLSQAAYQQYISNLARTKIP